VPFARFSGKQLEMATSLQHRAEYPYALLLPYRDVPEPMRCGREMGVAETSKSVIGDDVSVHVLPWWRLIMTYGPSLHRNVRLTLGGRYPSPPTLGISLGIAKNFQKCS
jgi:hypothetical protein